MKKILVLFLSVLAFFQCTKSKGQSSKKDAGIPKSIYDFKVESLDGDEINFADFKGKKILIVNTASKCGFTPQYEGLEKLYEKYKDKLVVVGFPADNFAHQEPGSNEEIQSFCKKNYGVTFPMAAKVSVKGEDTAPIFRFLTEKKFNGVKNTTILWNFTKFLLDENGRIIDTYLSTTKPNSESITKHLQ
ncbi:glutathione peroxidase [Riemerella columbipharyngis]|uniref:Glutathione peroxidase n=1 Tax=Riemerella columbipharyngis TaxID=1071918 RepID=A0A1G6YH49_9FLAO|nr:glutathione peroxidase [Riemerella columbipharyngis]SDD88945.1 glutathione peroxidase [Riemerella columbipharyngis]